MNEDPFWVVWSPDDMDLNSKHPTEDSAATEAYRLADTYPGDAFYVMEVVGGFRGIGVQGITINKKEGK